MVKIGLAVGDRWCADVLAVELLERSGRGAPSQAVVALMTQISLG